VIMNRIVVPFAEIEDDVIPLGGAHSRIFPGLEHLGIPARVGNESIWPKEGGFRLPGHGQTRPFEGESLAEEISGVRFRPAGSVRDRYPVAQPILRGPRTWWPPCGLPADDLRPIRTIRRNFSIWPGLHGFFYRPVEETSWRSRSVSWGLRSGTIHPLGSRRNRTNAGGCVGPLLSSLVRKVPPGRRPAGSPPPFPMTSSTSIHPRFICWIGFV